MTLEKQKRYNRMLREKVQDVVKQMSQNMDFKKENEYHIFVNGRNTGEVVKVPEVGINTIADAVGTSLNKKVSLTHRNMYISENWLEFKGVIKIKILVTLFI